MASRPFDMRMTACAYIARARRSEVTRGIGSAAGLREINVIAINLSVKLPRHTADDHVRQVRRYSHQESVVTGSFVASTGRII